jgi:capsular exopolysaccharide synthesis family protein
VGLADVPEPQQDRRARDDEGLAELWKKLAPALQRRVLSGATGGTGGAGRLVAEAGLELKGLLAQEHALAEKLKQITVKSAAERDEALRIEFAQSDVKGAEGVLEAVRANLKQQEYEAKGSVARIHLDYRARPTNRPASNHRLKAMAVAPVAAWFAVLGLLSLIELRSGRVADPDELPVRARLPVLGVVPPLPPARSAAAALPGAGGARARRQLGEFVQSLDHLRVALCARRDPWDRDRRCVLITSACGSEGKTTLAAQLAGRCVNAGLMTLLVDADLRSPALSRMLDAADSPGLVNVLREGLAPEEAMTVVESAGGFHFLPAGTPRVDPSRVLQGDRLGHLLARARETFDIVIVDAPPVLPVPDALTIGRWADGALLAVRHDTSRFPLVERAHRRLAHVGVPVFGAVVNGVRPSGASYGYHDACADDPPGEPAG